MKLIRVSKKFTVALLVCSLCSWAVCAEAKVKLKEAQNCVCSPQKIKIAGLVKGDTMLLRDNTPITLYYTTNGG